MSALQKPDDGFGTAEVSHRPQSSAGWIELLASGLTFDLSGLSLGPAIPSPAIDFHFGVQANPGGLDAQALVLKPGPHLSGADAMLPVVRVACGLAARLAGTLAVQAVCWLPARTAMAPDYFRMVIARWLTGSTFPALGLTALTPGANGALDSVGLSYFVGGEITVEAIPGETPVERARLAARIIDLFATQGPFEGPLGRAVDGAEGCYATWIPGEARYLIRRGAG